MKVAFTMRLPEPLYKKIEEIAKKEKRSMSSQIELFIEKYFFLIEKNEENEELKSFKHKTKIENKKNLFNINPKAILHMNVNDFEELKEKIKKIEVE